MLAFLSNKDMDSETKEITKFVVAILHRLYRINVELLENKRAIKRSLPVNLRR